MSLQAEVAHGRLCWQHKFEACNNFENLFSGVPSGQEYDLAGHRGKAVRHGPGPGPGPGDRGRLT